MSNFRVWDASEGRVLSNKDSEIQFRANDVRGDFLNPVKLYTTGNIHYEYSLRKGWNWVSFNLDVDKDLNKSLKSIQKNLVMIKDHKRFAAYNKDFGFIGSLDSIKLENSYLIKLNTDDVLTMDGKPLNLDNYTVDLDQGWNTISYFPSKSMDVNTALQNIAKSDGDIIKSQSEFAIYISDFNSWIGSLTYMHPGQGYYLEVANGLTGFKYPKSSIFSKSGKTKKIEKKASDIVSFWKSNEANYEHTMNMIVDINLEKFQVKSKSNIVLAAFVADECRGITSLESIRQLKKDIAFLSVSGNEGEEIRFRVINLENRIAYEMTESHSFKKDELLGSIDSAFKLDEVDKRLDANGAIPREFSLKQNYPNPFNPVTTIQYSLKEQSKVKLVIYNTLGQKVKELVTGLKNAGLHFAKWNGENSFGRKVASGIYFYRIEAGNYINTKKMVLMK